MHFPTKKNAEQSPKRIKNENWINMLKVPIGTSRVPINIWEVLIRTSTDFEFRLSLFLSK